MRGYAQNGARDAHADEVHGFVTKVVNRKNILNSCICRGERFSQLHVQLPAQYFHLKYS